MRKKWVCPNSMLCFIIMPFFPLECFIDSEEYCEPGGPAFLGTGDDNADDTEWWSRSISWGKIRWVLRAAALFLGRGCLWTQLGVLLTFLTIVTKFLIIINTRNKEFILAYSSRGTQFIAAGKRRWCCDRVGVGGARGNWFHHISRWGTRR